MNPERLLTQLTAKGIQITNEIEGGTTTGRETVNARPSANLKLVKLSASDIAASLAGLPRGPYLYAMAKYVDDGKATIALLKHMTELAKKLWNISDAQARVIAGAAVQYQIIGVKCSVCKGRTTLRNQRGVERECDRCEGSGQGKIKGSQLAQLLEISQQAFSQTWSKRVNILCNVLSEHDHVVSQHLHKKMKK